VQPFYEQAVSDLDLLGIDLSRSFTPCLKKGRTRLKYGLWTHNPKSNGLNMLLPPVKMVKSFVEVRLG